MASQVSPDVSQCVADLADMWLEHALEHLTDACESADPSRRIDQSRLAVVFSAAAVETRVNDVLREHDLANWSRDAQLGVLEKFQLLPRLTAMDITRHNELAGQLVEILDRRDALVGGGDLGVQVTPNVAWTIVTGAVEICSFFDTGTEFACGARDTVAALARHAGAPPPADAADFPPELVGS